MPTTAEAMVRNKKEPQCPPIQLPLEPRGALRRPLPLWYLLVATPAQWAPAHHETPHGKSSPFFPWEGLLISNQSEICLPVSTACPLWSSENTLNT